MTKAFGIPALEDETSVNLSGGFTARPLSKFSFTADFYHIAIDDRIVLTSRFANSDETYAALLAPFRDSGVSQAQFFANSIDTRTTGVDLVAAYGTELGAGVLDLTGAASFTRTKVDAIHIPDSFINAFTAARGRSPTAEERATISATLFNREEKNRVEDALPQTKFNLGARYTQGRFSATTRATYYGEIHYKPTNAANDERFAAKVILDLDLGCDVAQGIRLSVGANNLLNTFPDEHEKATNRSDGRFVYSRRVTQFGTNGGFYYGRLSLDL